MQKAQMFVPRFGLARHICGQRGKQTKVFAVRIHFEHPLDRCAEKGRIPVDQKVDHFVAVRPLARQCRFGKIADGFFFPLAVVADNRVQNTEFVRKQSIAAPLQCVDHLRNQPDITVFDGGYADQTNDFVILISVRVGGHADLNGFVKISAHHQIGHLMQKFGIIKSCGIDDFGFRPFFFSEIHADIGELPRTDARGRKNQCDRLFQKTFDLVVVAHFQQILDHSAEIGDRTSRAQHIIINDVGVHRFVDFGVKRGELLLRRTPAVQAHRLP